MLFVFVGRHLGVGLRDATEMISLALHSHALCRPRASFIVYENIFRNIRIFLLTVAQSLNA